MSSDASRESRQRVPEVGDGIEGAVVHRLIRRRHDRIVAAAEPSGHPAESVPPEGLAADPSDG